MLRVVEDGRGTAKSRRARELSWEREIRAEDGGEATTLSLFRLGATPSSSVALHVVPRGPGPLALSVIDGPASRAALPSPRLGGMTTHRVHTAAKLQHSTATILTLTHSP